jgi:hypothetical protein
MTTRSHISEILTFLSNSYIASCKRAFAQTRYVPRIWQIHSRQHEAHTLSSSTKSPLVQQSVCVCVCVCVRARAHFFTQDTNLKATHSREKKCIHAYSHTHTCTFKHTHTHTHTLSLSHTYIEACTNQGTHAHALWNNTHKHTQLYETNARTCSRTCMLKSLTHTRTYTWVQSNQL